MIKTLVRRAIGVACFGAATLAQAALPTVSLSFTEASGIVAANETIEVWVTLTVDAASSPLVFDGGAPAPFGFNAADLPAQGNYNDPASFGTGRVDFDVYTGVSTNTAYGCSGTFTNVCDAGAYAFDFHLVSAPGKPSFYGLQTLNLQPGQTFNYLFGTFTPVGGLAAPGTYEFFNTYATLVFEGFDANGRGMTAYIDIGQSCAAGPSPNCAFTRTVTAVPEPKTYALLALGLLMIGSAAIRRRDH